LRKMGVVGKTKMRAQRNVAVATPTSAATLGGTTDDTARRYYDGAGCVHRRSRDRRPSANPEE
jgi:hypothetical protein